MELMELVKKLDECRKEVEKIGGYGCDLFDGTKAHNRAMITVHMRNEDLPDGEVEYNTKAYNDYVVKNVFVGGVCFFSLLTMDEARNEGVFWGALV